MLDRALFWGPLAAMVAALPAAVRLSRAGIPLPSALVGTFALLCVPIVLLIAAGSVAWRGLGDLEAENRRRVAAGVSIWAAICLPVDAALGAVLQASTHHRPLGGVTFAAMAMGVAVAAALIAWRSEAVLTGLFGRGAVAVAGVIVLAALVVMSAKAWSGLSDPARACVVDAAVALLAIGSGVFVPIGKGQSRGLRVVGIALLAAILAIGWLLVGSSDQLVAAIGARAPVAWAVGAAVGIMP
jgi:choline-sulfatase